MEKIDAIAPGNNAAKASVDIALHGDYGENRKTALAIAWFRIGENACDKKAHAGQEPAVVTKLEEAVVSKIIKVA
ncbi:MAG: hypothetical protein R2778_11985 [Saprospiraceae bacterium]